MSKREETRPMKFDEAAAEERKMKELYGDSKYKPSKKGDGSLMASGANWRNP